MGYVCNLFRSGLYVSGGGCLLAAHIQQERAQPGILSAHVPAQLPDILKKVKKHDCHANKKAEHEYHKWEHEISIRKAKGQVFLLL